MESFMSYIACTSDCVYQKDGCCSLERAASGNENGAKDNACIHYVKTKSSSGKKRKPDHPDHDEYSDDVSCGCI
jgi:hypothetical protein